MPYRRTVASAIIVISLLGAMSCSGTSERHGDRNAQENSEVQTVDSLENAEMREYDYLAEMYADGYFPPHLVDKGKAILVALCHEIEEKRPNDLDELYVLTHAATNQFNDLAEEFYENDSEIETAARDCIGVDFYVIAKSYGFENADAEELIATRMW